ncbi:hypothetical protein ACROYT_G018330 [Oculina patagonica]
MVTQLSLVSRLQAGYQAQSGNSPPQQSGYLPQPAQQFQQSTAVISLGMPVSQTITLPPNRPRNYLCVSICTCLFCFWPLGLVAMVFSCMVDSSYDAGDYAGAFTNAAIAKLLNSISYLFGLFLIIVFITTL